jgi:2,5-diketo-D-gluconate reductase B
MRHIEAKDARIPVIGLGTWELEGDEAREVVERALGIGYRHVDTAQMYGNEAQIGAALAAAAVPREELFVTTKIPSERLGERDVQDATRGSLDRLRLDYLDLVLIHWPSTEVPLSETLRGMEALVDEGVARNIGVSNFTSSMLMEASELASLACIQCEYHPYLSQRPLLALARQRGMAFTAYSPLARGRVASDRTLRRIGAAHGKTAAQVSLRWLLDQENVVAIPKASSREHLEQNLDVFDFELTTEDKRAILELDRGQRLIDPDFAPRWENHAL